MTGTMILLSNPHMQCLTFYWKEHPQYWVGYRVLEDSPEIHHQPIYGPEETSSIPWGEFPSMDKELLSLSKISLPRKRWRSSYREKDPGDPVQLVFQAYADGSAWCSFQERGGLQKREIVFHPVEDGVEMWMRLTTQEPIEGSYLVQQCLRFTGAQNWSLRRHIARVPFLSELDVQAMGHPELTLTYARQGNDWLKFPAQHVQYAISPGTSLDENNYAGQIDHGLVVRETLDRMRVPASYFRKMAFGETWDRVAAGMYWERTAWVSNRHPADCIHSVVDLGLLPAGGSRTIRGKFYWIEGTKDDLLVTWIKDFLS